MTDHTLHCREAFEKCCGSIEWVNALAKEQAYCAFAKGVEWRNRSNAQGGEWREMDSAPHDKAIMGAWFGAAEYTEVSPVIYCSERGKWMNPDDMRDDEFTRPDMWMPYPKPPAHRDL